MSVQRYEVVVGDVHPYFDRYGCESRTTLYCSGMTNHVYLSVRDCRRDGAELVELLRGDVVVTCVADANGLYVELSVGRLTKLRAPVRLLRNVEGYYPMSALSECVNGSLVQLHVIAAETGVVLGTREFELAGATSRMLFGAIERYRAALEGEGEVTHHGGRVLNR